MLPNFCDILQMFVKFYNCLWNFTNFCEILQIFVKFNGFLWNFTNFCEILQIFVKFNGFLRSFTIFFNFTNFWESPFKPKNCRLFGQIVRNFAVWAQFFSKGRQKLT
jgi:hypothetical protein